MGFVLVGCTNTPREVRPHDADNPISGAAMVAAIAINGLFYGKFNKPAASETRVEAKANFVWSQKMENQKRQMQTVTAGTDVRVSRIADNRLKLNVPNDIAFDVDDALIKQNVQPFWIFLQTA